VGHYIIGKTMGEGTFGKVKMGTHLITGEKVAIKILQKAKIVAVADVERVSREIHILKRIHHDNIIQLYEVIDTPNEIYLIMEFADGGELFDYIVANTRVKEPLAAKFFHEICNGIDYVHSMNVIHRDLKPENLLLVKTANDWGIKVIDFGLSNTNEGNRLLKTACGSPCYAAPEMIAGHIYEGPKADVWSLGVILFAVVCGFLPFEDENTGNLYKKILSCNYKLPSFVSDSVKDLISKILNTDPAKRYTIKDIRNHPWMNQDGAVKQQLVANENHLQNVKLAVEAKLKKHGIDPEYAMQCVNCRIHNNITATYYLIVKQVQREMEEKAVSEGTLAASKIMKVKSSPTVAVKESVVSTVPEVSTPSVLHESPPVASNVEGVVVNKAVPNTSEGAAGGNRVTANNIHLKVAKLEISNNKVVPADKDKLYAATARTAYQDEVEARAAESVTNQHPVATSRRGEADKPMTSIGNYTVSSTPNRPSSAAVSASTKGGEKGVISRRVRAVNKPIKGADSASAAVAAANASVGSPYKAPLIPTHSKGDDKRSFDPQTDLIDVASTSTKTPDVILAELQRALTSNSILSKSTGRYSARCSKSGISFDVTITAMKNLDNIYVVHMKRLAGDGWTFKQIRAKLLATMRL
jgi:serine/threonine protein kinase